MSTVPEVEPVDVVLHMALLAFAVLLVITDMVPATVLTDARRTKAFKPIMAAAPAAMSFVEVFTVVSPFFGHAQRFFLVVDQRSWKGRNSTSRKTLYSG